MADDLGTIISFFPRRWGRNKPDSSGVHKGIRARLEHIRSGEIQSAYDLALLIMNQCSTVFFDRTKPIDVRPQVLDIFANAIAHIVCYREEILPLHLVITNTCTVGAENNCFRRILATY